MDMTHHSQKLRILGWRLFYFQQFLQLPLFGLFFCYIFFLLDRITFLITFSIINLLFSIVLLLNLLSILLISISPFIYIDYPEDDSQNSRIPFIILILGIIWVLWKLFFSYMLGYLSIIISWNLDFFKEYGFMFLNDIGYFRPINRLQIILNPLIYGDPLSILLLLFFFLQDNHFLHIKKKSNSRILPTVNMGTFYGLMLFLGDFYLLFFFNVSDEIIAFNYSSIIITILFLVIWKLLIIPLVGIQSARKYLVYGFKGSNEEPWKPLFGIKSILLKIKNIFTISGPIKVWPSRNTLGVSLIICLLLLVVPISPYFYLKVLELDCTPHIMGPYITRDASGNALEVLQYIENLPLNEVVGAKPEIIGTTLTLFMCNDTLNYFLDRIPTKESLEEITNERLVYNPEDYFFNWSVRVVKNDTSSIKPTELSQYWSKVSTVSEPLILTLWENNTQFWYNFHYVSNFVNVSFHPAWIFYGTFSYSTYCHGCIDPSVINAEQLILLDGDLKFICFIYDLHG